MSHSERLRLREVRAALRLVSEVRDLGGDAWSWRRHLAERLPGLFGAKIVQAGESILPARGFFIAVGMDQYGWATEREKAYFLETVLRLGLDAFPHMSPFLTLIRCNGGACRMRRQIADDRRWYRYLHAIDAPARLDQDDHILACRRIPGCAGNLNIPLYRAWGDRPFRESERRLLALLMRELIHLWKPGPNRPDPLTDLPPRWRQTLERLLAGDSEKLAAARLGLSRHTVHVYTKALHRRFQVSSRGELVAHCHRLLALAARRHPRLIVGSAAEKDHTIRFD